MNRKELRKTALDVDKLHLMADRLGILTDDYHDLLSRMELAQQNLKVIATWADSTTPNTARNINDIHNRAIDTLKLIGDI